MQEYDKIKENYDFEPTDTIELPKYFTLHTKREHNILNY